MNIFYRISRLLPESVKVIFRPVLIPILTFMQRLYSSIQMQIREAYLRWKFPLPSEVEEEILCILKEIPRDAWGACSWTKARALSSLIITRSLKKSVEIGVYRGSSLIPQAVAQKYHKGIVIGIDPYVSDEARQIDNRNLLDPIEDFFQSIDWDLIYQDVLNVIKRNGLGSFCEIKRTTSERAANIIEEGLDMVHIDGNHDYVKVENDIKNYLPKLRVGGVLVMDDICWDSIAPHYEELKKHMKILYEVKIKGESWGCLIKIHHVTR